MKNSKTIIINFLINMFMWHDINQPISYKHIDFAVHYVSK